MNSHVCHVINNLGIGGAEQYVVQLSNYLNSIGTRASIIAGEPQSLLDRLDSSVHVESLKLHPGTTRSPLKYMSTFLHVCMRLIIYFRRERVTVVHTHLAASAFPAWIAAKLCGIPVIHSKMYAGNIGSCYERLLFASRLPLILVDRFLVFTRYAEKEVREHWHVPSERVIVSSVGVDMKSFVNNAIASTDSRRDLGLSSSERVMLVVSRLHPDKDVELAIRAARSLDDPCAVLLIAGDGQEREHLERLVRDLPGRTRIRFLGFMNDPRPAYAAADLVLQTSRSPNLGTVVLEAMASGRPVVIAFRNEDEHKMAMDTFDGFPLGVIAEATPDAMATALRGLFADTARLETLSREVRDFIAQRHDRQTVYTALVESYFSH